MHKIRKEIKAFFSNRPVLLQICTVKCFSGITVLKHDSTLISFLEGGFLHILRFSPWPEIQIMTTFVKLNLGLKIGLKFACEPDLMQPAIFTFIRGFVAI